MAVLMAAFAGVDVLPPLDAGWLLEQPAATATSAATTNTKPPYLSHLDLTDILLLHADDKSDWAFQNGASSNASPVANNPPAAS
jgi:hypothetical protein